MTMMRYPPNGPVVSKLFSVICPLYLLTISIRDRATQLILSEWTCGWWQLGPQPQVVIYRASSPLPAHIKILFFFYFYIFLKHITVVILKMAFKLKIDLSNSFRTLINFSRSLRFETKGDISPFEWITLKSLRLLGI